jgi:hypothetical protein
LNSHTAHAITSIRRSLYTRQVKATLFGLRQRSRAQRQINPVPRHMSCLIFTSETRGQDTSNAESLANLLVFDSENIQQRVSASERAAAARQWLGRVQSASLKQIFRSWSWHLPEDRQWPRLLALLPRRHLIPTLRSWRSWFAVEHGFSATKSYFGSDEQILRLTNLMSLMTTQHHDAVHMLPKATATV